VPGRDAAGMEILSVGIVFGGRNIAWGLCLIADGLERPDFPNGLQLQEGLETFRQSIIPAIHGLALDDFRSLANRLGELSETATINRPIPQPVTQEGLRKLSRRDLFTGRAWNDQEEPATERLTLKRRLHPALRYGVTQAILAALASLQRTTVAEVICQEYGLPRPDAPVPLLLEMPLEQIPGEDLWQQAAAVALIFAGDDPEGQLGVRGTRMLRLVRQLKGLLVHRGEEGGVEPSIYVSLEGSLGRLHDLSLGKVLGSIYGLEQAAEPYTVFTGDPVVFEDLSDQIEKMAELKELVRMRGLSVQLVARAGLNTLDDVGAFLEADAVHAIYLDCRRLGGLNETIEAALAIRQKGKRMLLAGGDPGVLGQLALALRPDLVDPGSPAGGYAIRHEMDRALAWIVARAEVS